MKKVGQWKGKVGGLLRRVLYSFKFFLDPISRQMRKCFSSLKEETMPDWSDQDLVLALSK